jgi:hypothetical protein
MDAAAARETLGLGDNASIEEVRRAFRRSARTYHPDNPLSGDTNTFILVCTAYLVLQGKSLGVRVDESRDDLSYALNLRTEIAAHFDQFLSEFADRLGSIQTRVHRQVKQVMTHVDSVDELRATIDTRVSSFLIESSAEIELMLKDFDAEMRASESDVIFKLFREMYAERRRYWLMKLYRNPVTITEILAIALFYSAREAVDLSRALPSVGALPPEAWIPLLLVCGGLVVLIGQYVLLNPRRQFLPPRLSTFGLYSFLSDHVKKNIGFSRAEIGVSAAVVLAIIGTHVFPGAGTIVGAALGALCSMFGEDVQKAKTKAEKSILSEFDMGLEQIRHHVAVWAKQMANDLHRAALLSFEGNCKRVLGLIAGRHLPQRMLPASRRAIESGPERAA